MKKIALLGLPFLFVGCSSIIKNVPSDTVQRTVYEENKKIAVDYEKSVKARLQAAASPEYIVKPFSFDLVVKNALLKEVLPAIAEGTDYTIIVDDDVNDRITANWQGKSLNEILSLLRKQSGYGIFKDGKTIQISAANKITTRLYQISYLNTKRTGKTDTRVTSGSVADSSGSGTTAPTTSSSSSGASSLKAVESSRITTESGETNFWDRLKIDLDDIKGKDGSVNINPLSGLVTVTAANSKQTQIEDYIKKTQAVIERQVMLEAKIVEVALSSGFESGINWNYYGGADNKFSVGNVAPGTKLGASGALINSAVAILPGVGGAIAAASQGAGFTGLALQTANFASMISFLETQGRVSVLSSPRIATLNNQKAVLKVGTDDLFVTNITTNTTSNSSTSSTSPTINVQPFFSGIALDITPRIDKDNNVTLHVRPSVTEVTEKTKVLNLGTLGDYTLPLASSKVNEADSVVKVPNGRIVAIGGLMAQKYKAKGSELPNMGPASILTRNQDYSDTKVELVILLKPTVIDTVSDWEKQ